MSSASHIRILFVGAGSGGHFYPLIAIAEACNATSEKPRLYFAGPDPYDYESLIAENIVFVQIPAGKRRKYASFLNVVDLFKTLYGCFVATVRLYIIYPDVVMSKGGYTSVPVIFAARFLRIPIIIHESDAVMGSANKLALKAARHVLVNYAELRANLRHKSVHALGIPIRRALLTQPSGNAFTALGIDDARPVIFVIGGSQGAERVNALVLDALDELLTEYTIIHQTGVAHFELCTLSADKLIPDAEQRARYHPFPFLNASMLNDAYHLAHVVVSRAGSTSIYEIALHGKPSILIPIPEEISHDQRTNAYAYARISGATVMEEGNLTDGLLRAEIDRIMHDEGLYARMTEGARSFGKMGVAEQVAGILVEVAKEH